MRGDQVDEACQLATQALQDSAPFQSERVRHRAQTFRRTHSGRTPAHELAQFDECLHTKLARCSVYTEEDRTGENRR
jgi:hypothetical protein